MKIKNRNSKQHTNNFMKKFKKQELLPNIDPIIDLKNEIERLEQLKVENLEIKNNCLRGNSKIQSRIVLLKAKIMKIEMRVKNEK